MRHVIVGTAGHIDHGKSALVQALTGINPDRLKEEKLRGITIDLGFAHLDLGETQIGFVDVPGHERFVKNMLAGVGGIDFVLLVVAADESVMPQTREHFDICRLLGIRAGIVVIAKMDLVDSDMLDLVKDEVRETVRSSFLENAEIIPVSSKTGQNLASLKDAMGRLARTLPARPANRLLRLPIDRVFSIRGFGTVVTGTLTAGSLEKEQEIELIPGGYKARARNIQVHGKTSQNAVAGQRTAVNLQGVDLATVGRGMTLTTPHIFRETRMLDVRLNLLPAARSLRNLVKVRFHQSTAEVMARVSLIGLEAVAPGDTAYAQLRLDSPVFCVHGDPFIIRQFSPAVTIGGGIILHPHPQKHRNRDDNVMTSLQILDAGTLEDKIHTLVGSAPNRWMSLKELDSILGLSEADIRAARDSIAGKGKALLIPSPAPMLVLPELVSSLQGNTLKTISEFHAQNTLQKGISKEELRTRVYSEVPPEVFHYCLYDLASKQKIELLEEMVSQYGRSVQLTPQGEHIRELIESRLLQAAFQPPTLSELIASIQENPEIARKIYYWMLKEKILIKISEDLAFHRDTIAELKNKMHTAFLVGSRFGVAEFKQLFDITRKHAIPLLEYLDRERFTRRQGNDRILTG